MWRMSNAQALIFIAVVVIAVAPLVLLARRRTQKGRLRCHKRPKSREETPKEGSDSGGYRIP